MTFFTLILSTAMVLALAAAQVSLLGVHDWGALGMILLSAATIFPALLIIHLNNRQMWRIYAAKDSALDTLLAHKAGVFPLIFAMVGALFLAILLALGIKGMAMTYGIEVVLMLLALLGLISQRWFLWRRLPEQTLAQRNFNRYVINHAAELLSVLYGALFISVILSLVCSFYDVYQLMHSSVALQDLTFLYQASEQSQQYVATKDNIYGIRVVNLLLLLSQFKLALVKYVIELAHIDYHPLSFFLISFIWRFIRVIFFAWAMALWLKGCGYLLQYGLSLFTAKTKGH